jgi:hypothetical protein
MWQRPNDTPQSSSSRRAVESRRQEIAKDIRDAQQEFRKGRCRATTPAKIMKEILS